MSRGIFQDDRMPWSLFLPMTMAVVVGVLIADGVRYAIGEVFAARATTESSRSVPSAAAPAAAVIATPPAAAAVAPRSSPGIAPADGGAMTSPSLNPDAATATTSAAAPSSVTLSAAATATTPTSPSSDMAVAPTAAASPDQVERLPGSTSARRDQQPRACINGTVAVRDRNGWQQELSSDRPVRCEQTGP